MGELEKGKKRQKTLVVLTALLLCFIWGNSLMPAAVSGALSGWVKDLLNLAADGVGASGLEGDGLLRKLAHAAEFGALGLLLTQLLRHERREGYSLLFLCGLGVALVDETIQLFSPGRAGMVRDLWVDLAGFGAGVLLSNAVASVRRKRRSARGTQGEG